MDSTVPAPKHIVHEMGKQLRVRLTGCISQWKHNFSRPPLTQAAEALLGPGTEIQHSPNKPFNPLPDDELVNRYKCTFSDEYPAFPHSALDTFLKVQIQELNKALDKAWVRVVRVDPEEDSSDLDELCSTTDSECPSEQPLLPYIELRQKARQALVKYFGSSLSRTMLLAILTSFQKRLRATQKKQPESSTDDQRSIRSGLGVFPSNPNSVNFQRTSKANRMSTRALGQVWIFNTCLMTFLTALPHWSSFKHVRIQTG